MGWTLSVPGSWANQFPAEEEIGNLRGARQQIQVATRQLPVVALTFLVAPVCWWINSYPEILNTTARISIAVVCHPSVWSPPYAARLRTATVQAHTKDPDVVQVTIRNMDRLAEHDKPLDRRGISGINGDG